MRVLITGANGFIGHNLRLHFRERKDVEVVLFTRNDDPSRLPALVNDVDFIFHLAGINRPNDLKEFQEGNADLTCVLCDAITATGRAIPVIYTSSTQASQDNPYGLSKRVAEGLLLDLRRCTGSATYLFRLPNVFGKWSRPNYNSVVSTFCYNIANNLPIKINDPSAILTLVYVDDVVRRFIQIMDGAHSNLDSHGFEVVSPQYSTSVGQLARQLYAFKDSRSTLITERVGAGLVRSLYSTYLSYLPSNLFSYSVPCYGDSRGLFVEMLKTPDCGQFSYFTAHPGITRGGHYHHSKTEKFLVIKGNARFKFRNMDSLEEFEIVTSGEVPTVVETVPGWTHDITNIGEDEMIVMLWANELFDRANPDTYACPLQENNL
jgi:UDP-2-acetamido-2,6-beta-L-arabino-hexul-4-ose reductase